MHKKINVLVLNVPFHEGMAGTKRVKNLLLPLYEREEIDLSNLVLTEIFEKDRIGENGSINGIDYLYIGYTSFKNILSVNDYFKKGRQFIKQHSKPESKNIIYCFAYPDLKNLVFILYAKLIKYKIIFDIVEDHRHTHYFFGLAGKIKNKSSLYLLKLVPLFGDGLIVISNHLEKWCNSMFSNKIKVHNIPITINIKEIDKKKNEVSEIIDEVIIFYGGSFAPKDGLEYLLQAFKHLCNKYNNIRLVLTGEGQGIYMEKMIELIKANPKIDYRGFISTPEYYAVLQSSDICCMTRTNSLFANTGFPFKLGEFLAAGKAIIATNVGDVPLYLENGINALVISPESVDTIEEALSIFIENKNEIRETLGIAAKKTAKQYFDDSILSEKLLDIFKNL